MKRIVLCADDFAQSPAISEGILELAALNRLGAVSCMTESPLWPEMAAKLKAQNPKFQVGLHFNLTHRFDGNHRSIFELLTKSIARCINPEKIRHHFVQQWTAFENHYGRPPDYVDGHQHVHAFPIIRDVVLEETGKRNPNAWIRHPHDSVLSIKSLVLRTATRGLEPAIRHAGLSFNSHFAGFRPYQSEFDFPIFMDRILANSKDGTLVMCHPGKAADDHTDPISPFREQEFDYLKSSDFLLDLTANGVALECLSAIKTE